MKKRFIIRLGRQGKECRSCSMAFLRRQSLPTICSTSGRDDQRLFHHFINRNGNSAVRLFGHSRLGFGFKYI